MFIIDYIVHIAASYPCICASIYLHVFLIWYSPKNDQSGTQVLGQLRDCRALDSGPQHTQFIGQTPNSLKLVVFCRAAVLPPLGCVAGSFQTTLKNMSMWLLSLVPHMQPFESVQGNILQGLLPYLQNRTCGFNLSTVFSSNERKSIEPINSISIEHIVSVNVH